MDGRHLLAAFREGALNSSIRLSTLPSARPAIAPGGFVTRWPTKSRPRTTQSGQHSSEAGRQAITSDSVRQLRQASAQRIQTGPKGEKGKRRRDAETQRRKDAKPQRCSSRNGDGPLRGKPTPLGSSSGQIIAWLQLQMLMQRAQQIIA